MSNKDSLLYIEHMLDCIVRIEEYTDEGKEVFYQSHLIQDAVVRNLQTLAESSQRFPDAIKLRGQSPFFIDLNESIISTGK